MTKELSAGARHLMRLCRKDRDAEGWARVSGVVMPLASRELPSELVEIEHNNDGSGRMRLTDKGETILDWS